MVSRLSPSKVVSRLPSTLNRTKRRLSSELETITTLPSDWSAALVLGTLKKGAALKGSNAWPSPSKVTSRLPSALKQLQQKLRRPSNEGTPRQINFAVGLQQELGRIV